VYSIIAYPFIKLYELFAGSKNEKNSVQKTKEKQVLYEEPERFNKIYFYESGKKGIMNFAMLLNEIKDEKGKKAVKNALKLHEELTIAWNKGQRKALGLKE
jgi:hypothetical protein